MPMQMPLDLFDVLFYLWCLCGDFKTLPCGKAVDTLFLLGG